MMKTYKVTKSDDMASFINYVVDIQWNDGSKGPIESWHEYAKSKLGIKIYEKTGFGFFHNLKIITDIEFPSSEDYLMFLLKGLK